MVYDLQKASFGKRITAWIFDGILTVTLAVGFGFLLSVLLGYDGYSQTLDTAYAQYETEYGIVFDITQEAYQTMTDAQRQNYDVAYQALINDSEAMHAYNMMLNLMLVITSVSILLAVLLWEFLIPPVAWKWPDIGQKDIQPVLGAK